MGELADTTLKCCDVTKLQCYPAMQWTTASHSQWSGVLVTVQGQPELHIDSQANLCYRERFGFKRTKIKE